MADSRATRSERSARSTRCAQSPLTEFVGDVRRAGAALRSAPLLLVFSVAVALAGYVPVVGQKLLTLGLAALVWIVGIPVLLFAIGSVGTERVWYAAAFRGERMQLSALWRLTWGFMPRYLHLGLIVFWPYIAFVLAAGVLLGPAPPAGASHPPWYDVGLYGLAIRGLWPSSALYLVLPPLAVFLVARTNAQQFDPIRGLLLTLAFALLNLLLKGATAAFYLRHQATQAEEHD